MRREVLLITFITFIFLLNKVHGMVYLDGNTHLDLLYPEFITLPNIIVRTIKQVCWKD